ncbi:MAG: hypothetical protein QXQ77_00810 [Candidatus Aenigmatarchaeota archaeon]
MSIYPRVAIKGKTKNVHLHIRINNRLKERIDGIIRLKIKRPFGKIDIFEKKVHIEPSSFINEYFVYPIMNKPVGKYYVDGRFYWKKMCVQSETSKKDFFVIKEVNR